MNHFETLPCELIVAIFEYLSPSELTRCAKVCKDWRSILHSPELDSTIWKSAFNSQVGGGVSENQLLRELVHEFNTEIRIDQPKLTLLRKLILRGQDKYIIDHVNDYKNSDLVDIWEYALSVGNMRFLRTLKNTPPFPSSLKNIILASKKETLMIQSLKSGNLEVLLFAERDLNLLPLQENGTQRIEMKRIEFITTAINTSLDHACEAFRMVDRSFLSTSLLRTMFSIIRHERIDLVPKLCSLIRTFWYKDDIIDIITASYTSEVMFPCIVSNFLPHITPNVNYFVDNFVFQRGGCDFSVARLESLLDLLRPIYSITDVEMIRVVFSHFASISFHLKSFLLKRFMNDASIPLLRRKRVAGGFILPRLFHLPHSLKLVRLLLSFDVELNLLIPSLSDDDDDEVDVDDIDAFLFPVSPTHHSSSLLRQTALHRLIDASPSSLPQITSNDKRSLVMMMLQHGADPNLCDSPRGWSVIHYLFHSLDIELLNVFMKFGVSLPSTLSFSAVKSPEYPLFTFVHSFSEDVFDESSSSSSPLSSSLLSLSSFPRLFLRFIARANIDLSFVDPRRDLNFFEALLHARKFSIFCALMHHLLSQSPSSLPSIRITPSAHRRYLREYPSLVTYLH